MHIYHIFKGMQFFRRIQPDTQNNMIISKLNNKIRL